LAFVRLVTNPRVFERPENVGDAWAQVESWLAAATTWVPVPGDRHHEIMTSLMPSVTRSGLVPDAHLAALAIEHGLILQTADGDFARFSGLRWENPIA
jgi:toxin-antitoxin system PIN domain toxin